MTAWQRWSGTLSLLLMWSVTVAQAATYTVNPATGSDGNPGTAAQPWKTLAHVSRSVRPGDIVEFAAGTYTPDQYQGESGVPTWMDTDRLGAPDRPIILQAAPGARVVFDGRRHAYWMHFSTRQGSYAGHYIVVRNLTFQHYSGVAIAVQGRAGPAHHVVVEDCTFADFADNQSGALVTGHASHVLFRRNTITNMADPRLGGQGLPGSQHAIYVAQGSQHIVVEGNTITSGGGYGIHLWGHDHLDAPSGHLILRRNVVRNIHASGLIIGGTRYDHTYVYHNTFLNDPTPYPLRNASNGQSSIAWRFGTPTQHTRVLNNLGYGYYRSGTVLHDASGGDTDLVLDSNWWTNREAADRLADWHGARLGLAGYQAASGQEAHTKTGDPQVSLTGALQRTSGAIDAGTVLTRAVGAGSGALLRVGDAGFFTDGFGLVPGDTIQIEGQPPVRVRQVDLGAQILTLAEPRTWADGAGVSLPYAGAAPDMGAIEFGGRGTTDDALPAPTNVRLIAIQ